MKTVLIPLLAAMTIWTAPVAAAPDRHTLLTGHEPIRASHDHRYRRSDHRAGDAHRHNGYHEYRDHRTHRARAYASNAIRQIQEARRLGFYPDHPRWSPSYERHYRWALHADPHRLQREEYRRAAKLRELRRYHYRYGYHSGH